MVRNRQPEGGDPKILVFDIETTDLKGSFGEVLIFGYWWLGQKSPHTLNITHYKGWNKLPVEERDKYILEDISRVMLDANMIAGHFSSIFDFRFIQSRLFIHGMQLLPKIPHLDTWRVAKNNFAFRSNRMAAIAEYGKFGSQKDSVPLKIWRRSVAHDVPAINALEPYCIQDVRVQMEMTKRFLPLATGVPNVALLRGAGICPKCATYKMYSNGWRTTSTGQYRRWVCENGHWSREQKSEVDKKVRRLLSI